MGKEESFCTGHFLESLFLAHEAQKKLFQGHINTQIIFIRGEKQEKPTFSFG